MDLSRDAEKIKKLRQVLEEIIEKNYSPTVYEVAQQTGIHTDTLKRWLAEDWRKKTSELNALVGIIDGIELYEDGRGRLNIKKRV